MSGEFKTKFAENIFYNKYALNKNDTWRALSERLATEVCEGILSKDEILELIELINNKKFIPGGRYLYYAGRELKYYNNCFMLKMESDTREEWGGILKRASDCLMAGGGIGIDYSIVRPKGLPLKRTGGKSSGPIPLMCSVNEVGRNVMQGGSRRSAIWAGLNWQHGDADDYIKAKNWSKEVRHLKEQDFNFPAMLDMTNISFNWDTKFLEDYNKTGELPSLWYKNVKQMLKTGEPGFAFNFYDKEDETLRNACTELTSSDDSDVCNLGSINIGAIESLEEMKKVVELGTKFLICGTIKGDLPYEKVYLIREKNRRLGLGLMGMHEWLLKKGYSYEVTPELHEWLAVYKEVSDKTAHELSSRLGISEPVGKRAIAPTGTIAIMASTSGGIEPIYSVAIKRRYLTEGTRWKYEYVVDATANELITSYGIDPDKIETAFSLAKDPERRIKFQYDCQMYVDHAISSTINLPAWGSEHNNRDKVEDFAKLLAKYAHGLRGFTGYPDGARGGQPLVEVPYSEAIKKVGVVYDEHEERCSGGVCGL